MKKWRIKSSDSSQELKAEDVVAQLLRNRSITSKKEINEFLYPKIEHVTIESSGIERAQYIKFQERIARAIDEKDKIVIYGDYDVDGVCATAILWETLYSKSKNVEPYIPDRVSEGYGLSIKGIENLLSKSPDTKIIITVDNGIVAHEAVKFANKKGIDVVITDHHVKGKIISDAFCVLHTTSLCGAGIAWVIAKELGFETSKRIEEKLELACIATVADLVPLTHNNRAIVKAGLKGIKTTKRVGIRALLKNAGIDQTTVGVYAIGHLIAPRINATGRIQSAMNALRLICTNNEEKATSLSSLVSQVNTERQELTEKSIKHARLLTLENDFSNRINVVADKSYNPGIIGLIASGLVESYYKPSFAISIGDEISKGSARSITGVNIIELLRSLGDTLVEAGGHPMAAGFSIRTDKIDDFKKELSLKSESVVTDEILERYINIDTLIPFRLINNKILNEIEKLEPFGMGNPEPVFATEKVEIVEVRKIGKEKNHLKLKVKSDKKVLDAVAFKWADKIEIESGDIVDIAYTIDENVWNGKISIQLKIRDIRN